MAAGFGVEVAEVHTGIFDYNVLVSVKNHYSWYGLKFEFLLNKFHIFDTSLSLVGSLFVADKA